MDMVEKVARALCGSQPHMLALKQLNAVDWEYEVDNGWRDCKIEARAAIAAMREPTEAMIRAMRGRALAADCLTDQGARDIYSNAMHAALGEGE